MVTEQSLIICITTATKLSTSNLHSVPNIQEAGYCQQEQHNTSNPLLILSLSSITLSPTYTTTRWCLKQSTPAVQDNTDLCLCEVHSLKLLPGLNQYSACRCKDYLKWCKTSHQSSSVQEAVQKFKSLQWSRFKASTFNYTR